MPLPKRKSDLPVGAGRPYDLIEAAELVDRGLALGQTGMYRPMPTGLVGIDQALGGGDRKSTRLNSSHPTTSRMPSSA